MAEMSGGHFNRYLSEPTGLYIALNTTDKSGRIVS